MARLNSKIVSILLIMLVPTGYAGTLLNPGTMLAQRAKVTKENPSTLNYETPCEYIQSCLITLKIKSWLIAEPNFRSSSVTVITVNGDVWLMGLVDTYTQRRRVLELARRVKEVKSIKNDIRVREETDRLWRESGPK